MTLNDEDLFEAYTPEQSDRYQREARERWGEARLAQSERRLKRLSKDAWQKVQKEGGLVTEALAALMDHDADDAEVQEAIKRHHAWIENFYPAPAEVYTGLAQMYVEHPEFRAFYDRFAEGLADFMHEAMLVFALNELT